MIAPLPSRRRWWRWVAGCLGVVVLIWILVAWSETTIPLPSGAVIVIDHVTYGDEHEPRPRLLAKAANLLWDHPVSSMRIGTEDDTVCLWMSCRTRWSRRPANFENVFQVVLVDRDGWPHYGPGGGRFQECERRWDGGYASAGQRVDLNAMRRGSIVASWVVSPVIRPAGSEATVAAIDEQGQVLGATSIPYPGPLPPESTWTPDELPATRTDGDLGVTLHEVEFRPPPEKDKPGAVRGVSVRPKFQASWKGQACDDCQVATNDEYLGGMHSPLSVYGDRLDSSTACVLSPFEPAWEWKFFFFPGRTADFDEDDVWHSTEVTLPAAGKLETIEHRGTIGDYEYGIESAGGPGEHIINVPIGQQIGLPQGTTDDGSARFSSRPMQDAETGIFDVDSKVPFFIVSSPPHVIDSETKNSTNPEFHVLVRNPAGELIDSSIHKLSSVQWTSNMPQGIDHPREYWIVFLHPRERAIDRLQITFSQYRYTLTSFYIRPPAIEFYRQHNLLPVTMDLVSDE